VRPESLPPITEQDIGTLLQCVYYINSAIDYCKREYEICVMALKSAERRNDFSGMDLYRTLVKSWDSSIEQKQLDFEKGLLVIEKLRAHVLAQ
jgi:hypothetical protein